MKFLAVIIALFILFKHFEAKIQDLEKRITLLEDRAIVYGHWPEFLEVEKMTNEKEIHDKEYFEAKIKSIEKRLVENEINLAMLNSIIREMETKNDK